MSLDRSLRSAGHLTRHRNVLTRPERIAKLAEKGKFDLDLSDPLGLPKVGNRKVVAAKGPKKEAAAAPGAAVAAAPAGGAAAPAAGAAAGAAGKAGAGKSAGKPAAGEKPAGKGGDKKKK